MTEPAATKNWVPLSPRERRVVGVLVEKQKTTPEYYPMTIAALVSGCNQKSARDPVVSYDADDVEDILGTLRQKGAVVLVEGSGRVTRYKHTLYDWLDLRGKADEMAVLAELLLRGPQTEGDLRSRAGRMMDNPVDLPGLQRMLEFLTERGLVVYLSPPGQRRGVVVTHGLYPPDELEKARQAATSLAAVDEAEPRAARSSAAPPGWAEEAAALRAEVESLRADLRDLAAQVRDLKAALGA